MDVIDGVTIAWLENGVPRGNYKLVGILKKYEKDPEKLFNELKYNSVETKLEKYNLNFKPWKKIDDEYIETLERGAALKCNCTTYVVGGDAHWTVKAQNEPIKMSSNISFFFCHEPNRVKIRAYSGPDSEINNLEIETLVTVKDNISIVENELLDAFIKGLQTLDWPNSFVLSKEIYRTQISVIEYEKRLQLYDDIRIDFEVDNDPILRQLLLMNVGGKQKVEKRASQVKIDEEIKSILVKHEIRNNAYIHGVSNKDPQIVAHSVADILMTNS